MKKFFVFALAMVMVLGLASISFAAISGSAHDLASGANMAGTAYAGIGTGTNQICVFCHHPHRGANGSGDGNVRNDLLWNMASFSATTYATYAQSGSMNATDVGTALTSTNSPQSYLCMACHDGTIGANSLVRTPGDSLTNNTLYSLAGAAVLGTTLEDDHPVNITYPADEVSAGNLATNTSTLVSGTVNSYPLYAGKMQCGTCHDVHAGDTSASADIGFMRGDTVGSEICTDCHLTK